MDPRAQVEISRLLEAGESLLWAGVPRQGLLLRPADAFMIPFSFLWGGFAFFWEASVLASDAPIFFRLWGIPFVLIGIHMIVGRFFVDARARAKTLYALTNRRAIVVSGIFTQTINSIPLRTLTDISVQERPDRTGTILLGRPNPFSSWQSGMQWPGTSQQATPAFELIPDARYVHDQIIAAQRAA